MKPNQPIFTREAACQDCYRCLRECPVKAITVRNGMAAVDPDRCIFCGTCMSVCSAQAKMVRDDVPIVKMLLANNNNVIVSLAPSHAVAFPQGIGRLASGLHALGFSTISGTAVGAHIISREIAAWLTTRKAENNLPKLIISTACTSIVSLIRKHYSHLVPYLSPFCSPMIAHSRFLKTRFGDDASIVFVGPCPAKKIELEDKSCCVDAVLTFTDIKSWLSNERIDLDTIQSAATEDFLNPLPAAHGALYPIEGGMIESIRSFASLDYIEMHTISGLDSVNATLKDLDPESLSSTIFLELLSCKTGCINGVSMPNSGSLLFKRDGIRRYANRITRFAQEPPPLDVFGGFTERQPVIPVFSGEQVRRALERIGKHRHEDEINCGGCGYSTCREFAQALLEDRAEPAMCVSYMRSLAMKKANAMMQSMPAGAVIVNKDLRIIECNLRFVQIASPDLVEHYQEIETIADATLTKIPPLDKFFSAVLKTNKSIPDKQIRIGGRIVSLIVFPIEAGRLAGGIIQDITQPAVRKEQIISKVREVSRRQLTMVQQIASLLGENAANSETLLHEIIESFSTNEDESKPRNE